MFTDTWKTSELDSRFGDNRRSNQQVVPFKFDSETVPQSEIGIHIHNTYSTDSTDLCLRPSLRDT